MGVMAEPCVFTVIPAGGSFRWYCLPGYFVMIDVCTRTEDCALKKKETLPERIRRTIPEIGTAKTNTCLDVAFSLLLEVPIGNFKLRNFLEGRAREQASKRGITSSTTSTSDTTRHLPERISFLVSAIEF